MNPQSKTERSVKGFAFISKVESQQPALKKQSKGFNMQIGRKRQSAYGLIAIFRLASTGFSFFIAQRFPKRHFAFFRRFLFRRLGFMAEPFYGGGKE